MCTVTFIPKTNGSFVLTSNRDEAPLRNTIAPSLHTVDGVKCLFPQDAVAGGTWIGVSDKKRVICLLNGGHEAHKREDTYRMSRGIVVKNLLVADDLANEIASFNFEGIEPFTVIAVAYEASLTLFEFVWDGKRVHFTEKPQVPTIWSSSLLYTSAMKKKREQWFNSYVSTAQLSKASLLHFHKTAGDGHLDYDLIMDRGFVKTKSITQIVQRPSLVSMRYEDLQIQKISETTFN